MRSSGSCRIRTAFTCSPFPDGSASVDRVAAPQTILTRKTKYAIFLVLTINEGGEDAVRDALADLPGLTRAVGSRAPEAALAAIAAIGSDAWDRLFTGPRPKQLRPFTELTGDAHTAPSTPGDLLVHLKADQMDLCYEVGTKFMTGLGDAVTTVDEVHGFRYFDLRDLIGFVDGTENPTGQDAIDTITVAARDDADFAGGSYVAIQRYVHDLRQWDALPVEEQEKAIGRSKLENIEMADDVKPSNSHIALNSLEDENGNALQIVRDNMPYGTASGPGDTGTFYIAYSATPDITDAMLRRMFIGEPAGNHDRLLDFTTAVTGVQFFAPTVDFLEGQPAAPKTSTLPGEQPEGSGGDPDSDDAASRPGDGSLGIGSLR